MVEDISLTIESDESPSNTVIASFTHPGMAGLIASNYLIEELSLDQTGHIQTEGLPAIAPFADGQPYHHTRLHSRSDLDVTMLTSELPVTLQASEIFGRKLLDWILEQNIDEAVILLGISNIADVTEKDRIFYVASPDYIDKRLADTDLTPLGGGFLDGVNASLISRAIDTPLRAGVFVTPTRFRDIDPGASVQLIEALNHVYDLKTDTTRLRQFANDVRDHYEQLHQRMTKQETNREWDHAFM